MKKGLSCSFICWNESKTIDLALKSVADIADEVIIADTGSFDGTQKTARETIDTLNLSGEVLQVKVRNAGHARVLAFNPCIHEWVLILDSNQVISNALQKEIKKHITSFPSHQLAIASLNLMGDYEHYFDNLPYMAPHKILVRREAKWTRNNDRQYFHMREKKSRNWAVNLSRVRPAWRYWYRGEPFGREYYFPCGSRPGARGQMHELNRRFMWLKSNKYYSPVEYAQKELGLSLEEVKTVAPQWFLKLLQDEAVLLTDPMRKRLPEVIQEEAKNPRYKLLYDGDLIVDRWPEL